MVSRAEEAAIAAAERISDAFKLWAAAERLAASERTVAAHRLNLVVGHAVAAFVTAQGYTGPQRETCIEWHADEIERIAMEAIAKVNGGAHGKAGAG